MSTMILPTAPARVHPGQLLGARQLADVVRRLAKLKNPQSVEYLAGARMLDLGARTGLES